MVVVPSKPTADDIAMAYAGFLQDRLVTCAPSAVTVRFDGPPEASDPTSLVIRRSDAEDAPYRMRAAIERTPQPSAHELTVPAYRGGNVVGQVTLELRSAVADDALPATQLRLYARVAAAALVYDLPEGRWPSDLPSDFVAVEDRVLSAGAHLERVGAYAKIMVRALKSPLGLDDEFSDAVFWYSPFHDIGQFLMRDDVLRKPGRLDREEWLFMQTHTTRGREIVDAAIASAPDEWRRPDVLRNVVEFHHEALDGSGYPRRLAGDEVPLEARIVSVADIFDALTSARPYKPGWSTNEALEEIDRMILAGKIDPLCVTALVTHPDLVEAVAASAAPPPGAALAHSR
jgi:HD-GYP domain-containing protein (c-di-GMP phosphodiesterase class II)